jgi:MoaA/NifB/PqqE/SkfB family radical SAM enzyme/GT2 family glycosyltransferase
MISVVIAAYNAEKYISDVLDSVLMQTLMPAEIVIVNDGSRDRTLKVIKEYPKKLKPELRKRFKKLKRYKFISQRNKGPAGASNPAIKAARGDIIVSVDSDAILDKKFIEKAVGELKKDKRNGVVGGYIKTANPHSFWARMMGYDLEYRYDHIGGRRAKKALVEHISPNNTAYRKEIFRKAGYFDQRYHYCQDVEHSYRVVDAGYRIVLLKKVGSAHYWRETFWGYTKQQFNVSYWRMKLIRKQPGKVTGDKVAGFRMFMQIPITGLVVLLYIASAVYSPSWIVATVLLGALLIERYEERSELCNRNALWKMSYITSGLEKRKKQNIMLEFLSRLFYIVPRKPKFAQIEITNSCNLNCQMCPREFLKVPYKHMDMKIYKKVVDRLKGINTVTLTGWGEPFYYAKIFDCVSYAKKKGLKVKLTTNGVLLNDAKIKNIFGSGLDEITFSLDNIKGDPDLGHPNKAALRNIQKIIAIREKKRLEKPKVVLQPTMHARKARNVLDVIRWGAKEGADRVNIARLDLRFDPKLRRASEKEEKKLFRTADRLGEESGIRVDMVQHAVFDGFPRFAYKLLKRLNHRLDHKCSKTYNYVYINVDGFVTPCCFFPHMKRGDLKKQSLAEVWNGKLFRIFRKNQESICGKCDVMKVRYLEK